MKRVVLVSLLALAALVAGCVVRGHARVQTGPGYQEPPPPPPPGTPPPPHHHQHPQPVPDGDRTPPPPPPDPGVSTNTRVRAPDAPDVPAPPPAPALTVTLSTTTATRGSEINIYVNPARAPLIVYYRGRVLPKKTDPSGTVLTVTIPADAASGHFEVEWGGQRFRSPHFNVQ